MFGRKKAPTSGDVVAQLKEQVKAAKGLEAIPDQGLLSDARLNPATRAQADELTAARLRTELELEHKRQLRRERERDRVEERAARRSAAIDAARDATNPASTVLELTTNRRRYVAGALAASIVCSIGSAMSVEAAVQAAVPTAPTGIGYLAEVAMTGLATATIAWKGGLLRGRAEIDGFPSWVLAAMIAVPLTASIFASTAGAGLIGAVCSVGAGAFAWFAYLVSVTGAVAITQAVDRMDKQTPSPSPSVTVTEEPPAPEARPKADDGLDVVADSLAEEASEFLAALPPRGDDGDGVGSVAVIPRGDDGPTGDVPPPEVRGDDGVPVSLAEAARRRSESAAEAVRSYYAEHPDAPVKTAARELRMDPKTVRRYRPEGGGES